MDECASVCCCPPFSSSGAFAEAPRHVTLTDVCLCTVRKFITPGGGDLDRATHGRSQSVSPVTNSVHRAAHILEEMGKVNIELSVRLIPPLIFILASVDHS